MIPVHFILNGKETRFEVRRDERLLETLRRKAGITSVRGGCGRGECGACTVLLEKRPVAACLVLTLQVDGRRVDTLAGLEEGLLRDLRQAMEEEGAVACGHCTDGMLLAASSVLLRFRRPSLEQIRQELAGNRCRCGCEERILAAVRKAARRRAARRLAP